MCVSVVCMRDTAEPLLASCVPDLGDNQGRQGGGKKEQTNLITALSYDCDVSLRLVKKS